MNGAETHNLEETGRWQLEYFHNNQIPSDWYVVVDSNTPNKRCYFERLVNKVC